MIYSVLKRPSLNVEFYYFIFPHKTLTSNLIPYYISQSTHTDELISGNEGLVLINFLRGFHIDMILFNLSHSKLPPRLNDTFTKH